MTSSGAGTPMVAATMDRVPTASGSPHAAATHVRQDNARPIAVGGARRRPIVLEPESTSWFAPPALADPSSAMVGRTNRETRAALPQPEVQARFAESGGTPGDPAAEGFASFAAAEADHWTPAAKASGGTVNQFENGRGTAGQPKGAAEEATGQV